MPINSLSYQRKTIYLQAEALFERGSLQSTIHYQYDKNSSQNIWGYMVK